MGYFFDFNLVILDLDLGSEVIEFGDLALLVFLFLIISINFMDFVGFLDSFEILLCSEALEEGGFNFFDEGIFKLECFE